MKIYCLVTFYDEAAPELEFFSQLPTRDFTPDEGISHYELYEGYLDGGDSRPNLLIDCCLCNEKHATVSTGVTKSFDPTTIYRLTCGHSVI